MRNQFDDLEDIDAGIIIKSFLTAVIIIMFFIGLWFFAAGIDEWMGGPGFY